ncbi:MAG: hypothetical protein M1831_002306 [Alyxoria varia]|nr:MAG: hypothetical protein M1831_002306 [Alyxoria varia]
MESLLSFSFDNISSRGTAKIPKGLRQIDGLLAQISLARSLQMSPSKRRTSVTPRKRSRSKDEDFHSLESLQGDPAYAEFYKLQQSFEWNIATRLVECLERLLGMGSHESTDHLIAYAQETLLGTLLLHPPSKSLFARELYMNLLLDLLDPANRTEIIMPSLLVLLACLMDQPRNVRTFENTDGLHTVSYLYKSPSLPNTVKMRVLEIIQFYLMPETPENEPVNAQHQYGSSSKTSNTSTSSNSSYSSALTSGIRSAREKENLLGQYFGDVGDVVKYVRESIPFINTL